MKQAAACVLSMVFRPFPSGVPSSLSLQGDDRPAVRAVVWAAWRAGRLLPFLACSVSTLSPPAGAVAFL